MERENKLINRLIILNAIILVVSFLFCFRNTDMNVPGMCDECSFGATLPFTVGFVMAIIQGIMAVILLFFMRASNSVAKYENIGIMSKAGIFFTVLQILVFWLPPNIEGHDAFTYEALDMIKMYNIQFIVEKIASGIMMTVYVTIIVYSSNLRKRMKPETEEG